MTYNAAVQHENMAGKQSADMVLPNIILVASGSWA